MDDRSGAAARVRSFGYALRGIATMLRSEPNARIHLTATILVIGSGAVLDVSLDGWCWLVLAITAVWSAEAANTALERLADASVPETHPLVEQAKDVAAGGVLIAASGAVVIGLLVLGPRLLAAIAAYT